MAPRKTVQTSEEPAVRVSKCDIDKKLFQSELLPTVHETIAPPPFAKAVRRANGTVRSYVKDQCVALAFGETGTKELYHRHINLTT